ncbi:MAG: hypothetical protein D3923_00525 [Candidatus Electrothrix sp. AR3]|nr:hypothetical protein [Candidatus Electrothrix sp. AR3]
MDYSKILEELNEATLFDLYRLKVAIQQQLNNPRRLSAIKKYLKPDKEISYFDATENRLVQAKVIKVMRTRLLVQNIENRQRWELPLYYVNLDNVDTDIVGSTKMGLDKSQLKVGDMVAFQDRQNEDVHGKIIRLNPKTATIITSTKGKWRVAYEFLYLIFDGEQGGKSYLIEG